MRKIHVLDYNKYSKFMCEQLHYMLEMGIDNDYQIVTIEDVEKGLKLLIKDLYNMSDVATEKKLEYPKDYLKLYKRELEEKKAEIEELKNEIEELNNYTGFRR
ncbi:MAG: hypothetical protein U0J50_02890 [Peptacetobacter hiranonis]|nr:hypothetical protein [Peptacetobacter hiranonis]